MEFFVIIVYSFIPLTFFIENSVLDVLRVLDLPLITSGLIVTSNNSIFCRLLKYKIISLVNGCKIETIYLYNILSIYINMNIYTSYLKRINFHLVSN